MWIMQSDYWCSLEVDNSTSISLCLFTFFSKPR